MIRKAMTAGQKQSCSTPPPPRPAPNLSKSYALGMVFSMVLEGSYFQKIKPEPSPPCQLKTPIHLQQELKSKCHIPVKQSVLLYVCGVRPRLDKIATVPELLHIKRTNAYDSSFTTNTKSDQTAEKKSANKHFKESQLQPERQQTKNCDFTNSARSYRPPDASQTGQSNTYMLFKTTCRMM